MLAMTSEREAQLRSQIDPERLQKHLEVFSKLFRDSGTPDEVAAANYLHDELKSYGMAPDILTFRSYISWPREGSLVIHEGDKSITMAARTRSFGGCTPESGITAELAFVPFAEPPKGEMIFSHRAVSGDYSGLDVTGKIVISGDGGPDGIRRAQEHGAVAHVHIWPSDEDAIHEMIATPVWGTPTTQTVDRIPKIPALGITHQDGEQLREKLSTGAVTATLFSNVETAWVDLPLVVVDIPGTASDRFLLVGSHIDSWYEGITDNATGDVALLELARAVFGARDQLTYGVRFAWWPGHSTGRYSGSTWYADTHFMELRNRALGYLNIDSPGPLGATIWDCRYNCGEVEAVTAAAVQELSGQNPNIRRPLKAGDQSFLGVGLPSLGAFRMLPADNPDRKAVGGCGGGWWWHTPHDTLDKADKEVLAEDTRLYVTMISRMCAPALHPYNFVPVANDFLERLEEYGTAAGDHLDLSDTMDQAKEFRSRAESLNARVADHTPETVELFNTLHLRLSRLLNPILFSVEGPYEFDPALQLPVLPGLRRAGELRTIDKEAYGFLRTELVRQKNRITDSLQTATRMIDDFLQYVI